MLSTGGMLDWAKTAPAGATAIMATETGMLHPLRMARPDIDFVAANEAASCRYMKMITLPKLRDTLRDLSPVVQVPAAIAARARLPIERMVAIGLGELEREHDERAALAVELEALDDAPLATPAAAQDSSSSRRRRRL